MTAPIRNEYIFTLAQDWKRWCNSKRVYCAPPRRNILDQSATGEAPDAPLSPEMLAFDAALRALDVPRQAAVKVIYCGMSSVQQLVVASGVSRRQCYYLAHEGADQISGMMRVSLAVREEMLGNMADGV